MPEEATALIERAEGFRQSEPISIWDTSPQELVKLLPGGAEIFSNDDGYITAIETLDGGVRIQYPQNLREVTIGCFDGRDVELDNSCYIKNDKGLHFVSPLSFSEDKDYVCASILNNGEVEYLNTQDSPDKVDPKMTGASKKANELIARDFEVDRRVKWPVDESKDSAHLSGLYSNF